MNVEEVAGPGNAPLGPAGYPRTLTSPMFAHARSQGSTEASREVLFRLFLSGAFQGFLIFLPAVRKRMGGTHETAGSRGGCNAAHHITEIRSRDFMIPPFIYLDRYRNEGTRIYSPHADYTEAEERYRPNSSIPTFDLPAFQLPSTELNVYSADPAPALQERYTGEDRSLFCVHPQLLRSGTDDPYLKKALSYGKPGERIQVSPSSSTRTLYVKELAEPHALKVHFPFRVSRYRRRMREEVVEQAINVSRELQRGVSAMDPGFAFLREVLGVTFKNLRPETPRGENWGYLVRELTPFPATVEDVSLVPGFSLFGRDFFEPETAPLILDLVGDSDPRSYVLEQIMFPIIRHWVSCFLNFGLLLEPHGQNVLLEVSADGDVARIVYRDLNLGMDDRRRRNLRLAEDSSSTYNRMETGEFNSITYDKFMGGHFFDLLVATLEESSPGLRREDFQEPCRMEFARVFPEHEAYLPRTIRYFSEERDRFGKPLYLDTGQTPEWRP